MFQVCYYLPPSGNVNPKALVLYVGDAARAGYWYFYYEPTGYLYFPTGLSGGGTDKPLPSDNQVE